MFRLTISCCHCSKGFLGPVTQETRELVCPHCCLGIPFPNSPPGEALWLVALNKRKVGPFSMAHLSELATSGQLGRGDMLLLQGKNKWVEAKSVPGLFPLPKDEETPKLVAFSPAQKVSEDIFDAPDTHTPLGPLSMKGIKVRMNFSLTLGDFQILRKLGAGGMGAVYLALQRSMGRQVALKILSDTHAGKETFVNRFHREVFILAGLDHPNIVKFIGAGQEKGLPFFAMEFIEGFSASALVKQTGKLAVGDALHIIQKSAEALSYAFANKIVHRDIKPENIMITRQREIKIADMGLAKSLENADLDLTDSGSTLGSPKYMAPEQSRDAKHADQRSDIYALGGVLYYLLTAEEPFKGTSALELLIAKDKKLFIPARRLNPEVHSRLDLLIDKMLAKDPKYRYQGYAELLADLTTLGMTNDRLNMDPAQAMPAINAELASDLVEILLIDDDLDDVRLAKQALEENHIHSNLVVVQCGAEARAFLRHEGTFALAPLPHLIIFGCNLNPADSVLTLDEIKISDTLSKIPVVMLAHSTETAEFFESRGYQVQVVVNVPEDPSQFDSFFKSVQGLCLTLVDVKHKN